MTDSANESPISTTLPWNTGALVLVARVTVARTPLVMASRATCTSTPARSIEASSV